MKVLIAFVGMLMYLSKGLKDTGISTLVIYLTICRMTSLESSAPLYSMGIPMLYLLTTNVAFQRLSLSALSMATVGIFTPKIFSASLPMMLTSTPMVSSLSVVSMSLPPSSGLMTGNS